MRNRSRSFSLLPPIALAALIAGCASDPEPPPPADELTFEEAPDDVVLADDSSAFRVSGEGAREDFKISLRDLRLRSRDLSDLGLFRVTDDDLVEVPFALSRDAIEADLIAGELYAVIPLTSPMIVNTYRLGCHFREIVEGAGLAAKS